jgi:hypothetical protein
MKITGWWLSHLSETYESQLGILFPIYGKIEHVPNHQPHKICCNPFMSGVRSNSVNKIGLHSWHLAKKESVYDRGECVIFTRFKGFE